MPHKTFVTHLERSYTGETYEADRIHGLSREGKPLLVRYDLAALGAGLDRETLSARSGGLWKYLELLPVRHEENIISLGEELTPLVDLPDFQAGSGRLMVKDARPLPAVPGSSPGCFAPMIRPRSTCGRPPCRGRRAGG